MKKIALMAASFFLVAPLAFASSFTLSPNSITDENTPVSTTNIGVNFIITLYAPVGSQTEADCVSMFGSIECAEISTDTNGSLPASYLGTPTPISLGVYTFIAADGASPFYASDCRFGTIATCSASPAYLGQTEIVILSAPSPSPASPFSIDFFNINLGAGSTTLLAGVGASVVTTGGNFWPLLEIVGIPIAFLIAWELVTFIRRNVA